MAESTMKIDTKGQDSTDTSFVLPAKPLMDIVRGLSSSDNLIKLSYSSEKNLVSLVCNDIHAGIRVINGEFPSYKDIIPAEYNTEIKINQAEFLDAVKLVNVFAKATGYTVQLELTNDGSTVRSRMSETGKNDVSIQSDLDGDDITISFNGKYITDFLNNLTANDIVTIKTIDSVSPGLFKTDNTDYWYLVMPIKLNP